MQGITGYNPATNLAVPPGTTVGSSNDPNDSSSMSGDKIALIGVGVAGGAAILGVTAYALTHNKSKTTANSPITQPKTVSNQSSLRDTYSDTNLNGNSQDATSQESITSDKDVSTKPPLDKQPLENNSDGSSFADTSTAGPLTLYNKSIAQKTKADRHVGEDFSSYSSRKINSAENIPQLIDMENELRKQSEWSPYQQIETLKSRLRELLKTTSMSKRTLLEYQNKLESSNSAIHEHDVKRIFSEYRLATAHNFLARGEYDLAYEMLDAHPDISDYSFNKDQSYELANKIIGEAADLRDLQLRTHFIMGLLPNTYKIDDLQSTIHGTHHKLSPKGNADKELSLSFYKEYMNLTKANKANYLIQGIRRFAGTYANPQAGKEQSTTHEITTNNALLKQNDLHLKDYRDLKFVLKRVYIKPLDESSRQAVKDVFFEVSSDHLYATVH